MNKNTLAVLTAVAVACIAALMPVVFSIEHREAQGQTNREETPIATTIAIDPSVCTYVYHESGEKGTLCVRDTAIDMECLDTREHETPVEDGVQYSLSCSTADWKPVAISDDTQASDWGPNGEGF